VSIVRHEFVVSSSGNSNFVGGVRYPKSIAQSLLALVLESRLSIQVIYKHGLFVAQMNELDALNLIREIPPLTVVPTFWCVTCQLSLSSQDELVAHTRLFPAHKTKAVERLVCPRCGNVVPLEHGMFPDHWVGSSRDPRKCNGSRRRA